MLVTKDSGVVMARKDWRGSGSWEKIIIFFSEKYNLVWMMYDIMKVKSCGPNPKQH